MDNNVLMAIIAAVFASSGFWAFLSSLLQHFKAKKSSSARMLLGLGHDRIIFLCDKYIQRGYITSDEYDDLCVYLYEPYEAMGGNGSAKRAMEQVKKLPIK